MAESAGVDAGCCACDGWSEKRLSRTRDPDRRERLRKLEFCEVRWRDADRFPIVARQFINTHPLWKAEDSSQRLFGRTKSHLSYIEPYLFPCVHKSSGNTSFALRLRVGSKLLRCDFVCGRRFVGGAGGCVQFAKRLEGLLRSFVLACGSLSSREAVPRYFVLRIEPGGALK